MIEGKQMEWQRINLPKDDSTIMCYWKGSDEGLYEMEACFFSEGKFGPIDPYSMHVREDLPDFWRYLEENELPE